MGRVNNVFFLDLNFLNKKGDDNLKAFAKSEDLEVDDIIEIIYHEAKRIGESDKVKVTFKPLRQRFKTLSSLSASNVTDQKLERTEENFISSVTVKAISLIPASALIRVTPTLSEHFPVIVIFDLFT